MQYIIFVLKKKMIPNKPKPNKCNKYISDLKIYDYILNNHNGKDKYVKVKGSLHKSDNENSHMIRNQSNP